MQGLLSFGLLEVSLLILYIIGIIHGDKIVFQIFILKITFIKIFFRVEVRIVIYFRDIIIHGSKCGGLEVISYKSKDKVFMKIVISNSYKKIN